MNRLVSSLLLCLALASRMAFAAEPEPAEPAQAAEPVERDAAKSDEEHRDAKVSIKIRNSDDVVFNAWGDARLPANEETDGVIAIFGDAQVEGEVNDAVVTIFGNAHVTGDVHGGVISLFGNTYIDGRVQDAAVAVFGDLELGPHAVVDSDIAVIAGKLIRDPQAVVNGHTEILAEGFTGHGVRVWIEKCLLYARPLAFEPGLGWAWAIAFGFLLFYVVLALMFDRGITRCVETLETQPGQSVVASILTVLSVPVLFVLLVITVVGIAVVPFAGMALICAALFGKAVVLAALGRRVTRFTGVAPFGHVAFATLVGGLIAMGLYVIPVLGFIVYKLLGVLGMGVVVYTVLLSMRARSAARAPAVAVATAGAAPAVGAVEGASADAATSPPPSPAPPATDVSATAAARAGFWIRMGALLIDIILVSVIVSVLNTPDSFWIVGIAAYGAIMWKIKGTTIGGIVCGLKIVRRDGAELNWDTAIVRALGCFLSLVVCGLGFLWIVFDEDRQAWHDKIAGTLVVRTPRPQSLV
jgi:uncharacterized RDD family membrane protein YckC/cytoskeletal protein CcmA (bactofilin family)